MEIQVTKNLPKDLSLAQIETLLWSYCGEKLECLKKTHHVCPSDHIPPHMLMPGIKPSLYW